MSGQRNSLRDAPVEAVSRRPRTNDIVDNNQGEREVLYVKAPLTFTDPTPRVLPQSGYNQQYQSPPRVQRRRRGGGTKTLYVRTDDSESEKEGSSDGRNGMRQLVTAAKQPEGDSDVGEEEDSSSFMGKLAAGGDAFLRAANSIPGTVFGVCQKWHVTGILIFLFFFLCFIFFLMLSAKQAQYAAKVIEHDNRQSLLFTASLVDQHLMAANEARKLMGSDSQRSAAALKEAKLHVEELAELCDGSIKQLHSRILYPGPVEDIKFLLEEHVAYEANLVRLIKEEVEWFERHVHHHKKVTTGPQTGVGNASSKKKERTPKHRRGQKFTLTKTGFYLGAGDGPEADSKDLLPFFRVFLGGLLGNRVIVAVALLALVVLYRRLS